MSNKINVTPEITRLVRFGARVTVWLACGHTLRRPWADVKREQLYQGKRVRCQICLTRTSE